MPTPDPTRTKDLARIHMAAKKAGLDSDSYRDFLKGQTGKTSAGELTYKERWVVLQALEKLAPGTVRSYPGRPQHVDADKARLIGKIEAHLAESKRPWSYADGMARRMFKREAVKDCDRHELVRIVAALEYDAKRRAKEGK